MWHLRFFGTQFAVLALLSFLGSQTALAGYHPASSEFSISQSQETRGLDGSFQVAVMGSSTSPLDIPTETFPKKAQPVTKKPQVTPPPAVEKPKTNSKKASKPKKKKVKAANVKKAPAKKSAPVVVKKEEDGFLTKTLKTLVGDDSPSKSLEKKEEGLLTKTLSTLVGDDKKDEKKAVSKPKPKKPEPQKVAKKKAEPEKKEEGFLTKTLKTLVGGDEDKDKKKSKKEETAKKEALNPINMVPTGSAKKKKKEEQPKTAISETKKTLKDSFEKLIGVGAVDKPAEETKPAVTKQAKAEKPVVKKAAPPAPQPKRITARKYLEEEEAQLEKDRGGVAKGKNVLKESFKTLVTDDKKKALAE